MKLTCLALLGVFSCFTQTAIAAKGDCPPGFVPTGADHPKGCIKKGVADPCPGTYFINKPGLRPACVTCAEGYQWNLASKQCVSKQLIYCPACSYFVRAG